MGACWVHDIQGHPYCIYISFRCEITICAFTVVFLIEPSLFYCFHYGQLGVMRMVHTKTVRIEKAVRLKLLSKTLLNSYSNVSVSENVL